MTIEEIKTRALILGFVSTTSVFKHGAEFFRFAEEHDLKPNSIEWKSYLEKDLSTQEAWITYSGNIATKIEFYEPAWRIIVTVYDGENLNGYRTGVRFEASYGPLPYNKLIKNFERCISRKITAIASQSYDEELEDQKHQRILEIEAEIIDSLK